MVHENTDDRTIKASETAFAIIETIHELEQVPLTTLASRVGIANSTAFTHLKTLERLGYVVEESDGYRLGLKLLDHGMQAKYQYQELTELSRPVLTQLTTDTDETVNLVVEEHNRAVYIERLTGERGIPTNSWIGKRKHIHSIAAGKAILAHLPRERVDEIIDCTGLPPITDHTITSRESLYQELEQIRDSGLSFNDRESHESVRGVGTPILLEDRVYGAVSVAGPAKRLEGEYFESEIPDLLLGAVNEIELKLIYQ